MVYIPEFPTLYLQSQMPPANPNATSVAFIINQWELNQYRWHVSKLEKVATTTTQHCNQLWFNFFFYIYIPRHALKWSISHQLAHNCNVTYHHDIQISCGLSKFLEKRHTTKKMMEPKISVPTKNYMQRDLQKLSTKNLTLSLVLIWPNM